MVTSQQVVFLGVRSPVEAGGGANMGSRGGCKGSDSQRHVIVGELLVGGMKSAFRGYFPPFKYRSSSEGRDLRGYVRSLMADDGLECLAEGGKKEMARLAGALTALDIPATEGSHYTWEDFLGLLGQEMGGSIYKEGVGFVVPDEDDSKSLSERMAADFDQATRALDEIAAEGTTVESGGFVGGTREAFMQRLNQVVSPGEYGGNATAAQSTGKTTLPMPSVGPAEEAAMEVDQSTASAGDEGESDLKMRRLAEQIAAVERELAELKMGNGSSSGNTGGVRSEPPPPASSVAPSADSSAWLGSRWKTALQISDAVEDRMAAKASAPKKSKGDSFLRKGPLSPEQEQEVDDAFDGGPSGEILVRAFNADLSRRDLLCLRPYTWLNDEVVNMYMQLLGVRDKELCKLDPSRRASHFFSSFFLTKLRGNGKYNYAGVRRWTRKVKVFQMDKLFVPVNVSNAHWCMAIIYMQKKRINYYDSMGGAGKAVCNSLLLWLEDEDEDKNGDNATFDPDEWTTVGTDPAVIPQQENGSDCGAFAVSFASYASDDLSFDFKQADITQMRRRMLWSLLRQRLV